MADHSLDHKVNTILAYHLPVKTLDHDYHYMILLMDVAMNSDGQLNQDPAFLKEKLSDAETGPRLKQALSKAWEERKYQSIRDIDYLRASIRPSASAEGYGLRTLEGAAATEKAWNVGYAGEAAFALLHHIKNSLPNAERNDTSSTTGKSLYATYTAIIQSSGMGKSRTVDEMAKSELVIPMVLRPEGQTGYPPPDLRLRTYMTDFGAGMFRHTLALLQALFEVMNLVIESEDTRLFGVKGLKPFDKSKPLAPQFRAYMNRGMSMTGHGPFRRIFYDKVVEKANEIRVSAPYEELPRDEDQTTRSMDDTIKDPTFPLNESCHKLLDAMRAFKQHPQARDSPSFIILSFDEIHVLGDHYIEFRRALRALLKQPVFSILLSTAGHMYKIIPNPSVDPSSRMVNGGSVIPPFSELGFDHFAKNICVPSSGDVMNVDVKLSHVSDTAPLLRFGRPLWATRYNQGDASTQLDIIRFALSKLLGGMDPWRVKLDLPHQLGCLAQRLPIEFLSVSYSSSITDPQTEQVRSHLRVVLRVDHDLETMITLSPSEPILSEAVYWMMYKTNFKPAETLKGILGGFSVHKGDRGELLVMLLLTIARDNAVGGPDDFGSPKIGHRWCSVMHFLSNLFVAAPWQAALEPRKLSMETLFQDSKLYFNHFVKVHQLNMMNIQYIMRLMARGAAILCANAQKGIDLLVPFILEGDVLEEGNMGVILVQVKNDQNYTATPKEDAMKNMSFESLSNIPTLRFFFALAAKTPGITAVTTSPQSSKEFDFWVAGLSSANLRPVEAEGDAVWKGLLDASYGWDQIYREPGGSGQKGQRDRIMNLRRSMDPGAALADAHWNSWWKLPAKGNEEQA